MASATEERKEDAPENSKVHDDDPSNENTPSKENTPSNKNPSNDGSSLLISSLLSNAEEPLPANTTTSPITETRYVLFNLQAAHEAVQRRAKELANLRKPPAKDSRRPSTKSTTICESTPEPEPGLCQECFILLSRQELPNQDLAAECSLCNRHIPEYISIVLDMDSSIHIMDSESLMKVSRYFYTTLMNGYQECLTGVFHFEDISSVTWAIFTRLLERAGTPLKHHEYDKWCNWIEAIGPFDDKVFDQTFRVADTNDLYCHPPEPIMDRLIDCYLLGEYLQAPWFCNASINLLQHHYDDFIDISVLLPLWPIQHAFEGIEGSALQRLTAEMINMRLSDNTLRLALREGYISDEAAVQVALSAFRAREEHVRRDFHWCSCLFHDHSGGRFDVPCEEPTECWGRATPNANSVW